MLKWRITMNGNKDSEVVTVPVTDINNIHIGERPPHRALSMSSVASSSIAPTSVLGDLSSLSADDSDDNEFSPSSPSKKNEIDRFGFTGGSQYTDPSALKLSVEKIRYREQKWLEMLNNWERWMSRRFSQVKNRCRKGIPPSLRGRAWQKLSGAEALYAQNAGKYQEYLLMEANPNCLEDIEKDLHRQFPFHEMFVKKGGSGQQDLRDVLRAYSVYNPDDGYCQGQAPIAAVLLMHMPAEEAFWCMVAMCEHYLQGYFSPGLEAIQIDGFVMQSLLKKVSPVAYKHLEKNQVTPVLYMTEWFMCVFSRTLPWTSVLRLWDMFFCEGIKVVFRCALVLIRNTLGMSEKIKAIPGLYETMEALRKIDPSCMREDRLMFEIVNLKISERDLEHEHKLQKIKWKKDKNSGPTISSAGKEGKRVYRYTPTYLATDTTYKNRSKSKKDISAISVNSLAIIEQTNEAKARQKARRRRRAKKKVKMLHENAEDNSEAKIETEKTGNNQIENRANVDSPKNRRTPTGEPLVTGFSKNLSQPKSDTLSDARLPNENGTLTLSEFVNKKDELTVF